MLIDSHLLNLCWLIVLGVFNRSLSVYLGILPVSAGIGLHNALIIKLVVVVGTLKISVGHGKEIHCFSGKTFPTLEVGCRLFFN